MPPNYFDLSPSGYFEITEESFEQLYKCYWEKIYGICYYQTRDEMLAEELVQDIFESIWTRRATLIIHGPVEHYLVRAAKLQIIKAFRDKNIREKNLQLSLEHLSSTTNSTEEEVNFNLLQQQVQDLISSLPQQCQTVFRLSREKGKSNTQISAILSISEKTVKNHLNRALGFIRKNLQEAP